ncbi:unnamed protein product [Rhizoctonia solani]|uniref:Uncharacterized protein n=1 Tax=Rhizoctonia solani TaxID=456999 RepID=A0A8H3HEN4_9AGAM|nr:unnamed protein product [Rhizoctonia solani]
MAPTFTIYQDPPAVSQSRASSKPLSTQSSSARSFGHPASCSTSLLARDADKENVDPATGKARATTTKLKNKKSLSSKNKDASSKPSSKTPKASRSGSAAPGPAKSGKAARISPYPDPVVARDLTELPLADLSEAFASGVSNGTKKSACQNRVTMPNEFTLSFLDESMICLPPTLPMAPRFERHYASIADFDSDVSVF